MVEGYKPTIEKSVDFGVLVIFCWGKFSKTLVLNRPA